MKSVVFFVSLLSVLGIIFSNPVIGGDEAALDKPEEKSEAIQAVQEKVDEKSAKDIKEKRKKILTEATAAISESRKALRALDENNIDEAKTTLQNALDTLVVVTEAVIPLPVVRAEQMLKEAEKLAEKEDRNDEENDKLSDLLEEARTQLKMAELLGYGDEESFKSSYKQLDAITKKTEGGKSGKGFFDKIKQTLSDLM